MVGKVEKIATKNIFKETSDILSYNKDYYIVLDI